MQLALLIYKQLIIPDESSRKPKPFWQEEHVSTS